MIRHKLRDQAFDWTPKAEEFLHAPERYRLFGGAVGGGKTAALAVCSILAAWEFPNNEGVVGRRDFDDLRRTTYDEVLNWCPDEIIAQHHRSEHWLKLTNGSIIHFMELKDEGGVKNLNLGFFAIDQAEEVPYTAFVWLQSRLRRAGVGRYQGLLSANPEPGWVKKQFIDQQQEDHRFIRALPEDNAYLPSDYVSNLLQKWPETYVRRLLQGEWDVVENAIYPQLDRRRHLLPLDSDPYFTHGAIGVDYGDVHPSAAVAVLRDSDGRYWVRECWCGHDFTALERTVARMKNDYGIHKVRVDPMLKGWENIMAVDRADSSPGSRKARIENVTRLLNMVVTPRVLEQRDAIRGKSVSQLEWDMAAGRELGGGLVLDRDGDGCQELFDEMLGYHYDERETDLVHELIPVRKNDDRVAALEYAIEALEGRPPLMPNRVAVQRRRTAAPVEWRRV